MSDSFADLWNLSAPTPSSKPPQKLGTLSPNPSPSLPPPNKRHDAFSLLASTSAASPSTSRPISAASIARTHSQQQQRPTPKPSGDAFGDLLSASSFGGGSNGKGTGAGGGMTIAERAAAVRAAQSPSHQTSSNSRQSSPWDGLDSLGARNSSPAIPNKPQEDDWAFGFSAPTLAPSPAPVKPSQAVSLDDWGFDEFASPASSSNPTQSPAPSSQPQKKQATIWDFDDLVSPSPSVSSPQPSIPSRPLQSRTPNTTNSTHQSGTNTPGDFDFGDREDNLLDSSDDEMGGGREAGAVDDGWGELDRPVRNKASPKQQQRQHSSIQSRSSQNRPSPPSPPPHILGQLVEMGFSPGQARSALMERGQGEGGWDVEGALEVLLAGQGGGGGEEGEGPRRREAPLEANERPRRTAPQRSRDPASQRPRDSTTSPHLDPTAPSTSSIAIQEQADKLLAQASEIGMSVFSRAGAFWREGREKVAKVYEERAGGSGGGLPGLARSGSGGRGGREGGGGEGSGRAGGGGRGTKPRWMMDGVHDGDDSTHLDQHDEVGGGFKDDHGDDHGELGRDHEDGRRQGRNGVGKKQPPSKPAKPENLRPRGRGGAGVAGEIPTVDLFSDSIASSATRDSNPTKTPSSSTSNPNKVYQSPFRHGKSRGTASPSVPPTQPPAPPPLIKRPTVPASPTAIATANKHKTTGTDKFKLGQYAEAESSYTLAISSLPPTHLLQIPLYNNRALSRLKTGDYTGAIEDATFVIELVGVSYKPGSEERVEREEEGGGVELGEGLVKAFRRRAEAEEGKEKWEEAGRDWEWVAGCSWAGGKVRGEAVKAAGRCRRMVNGAGAGGDGVVKPTPKPTPKLKEKAESISRSLAPTPPSSALSALRTATSAAEAEDTLRHSLKDSVDAKILAWKGGKEGNVRALIASLDMVLWKELGWVKVGMHELVSEGQVKGRYVRAIAKVHPDKLNASNTTVEQRMIANGVFGALNDAWNAFKQ
ncbi:hypothetical protein JAAARDRAFT_27601 [Jaapia argillacea MUCL 33604]|uniref:UBA domain-containing protein n=1 Tax=Jaapia argillacea MUCL 33604 TaxID=933084 RepID=A0A067QA74_9AGAM|nr:hypothetical protein JAAARDRAFT_27601 [Jaapia argillacea MUCL 33604]